MTSHGDVFLGILIFSFGLFTLLAGLFTAYFGAGKSRAIGFVLTIIGLVGLLAFASLTWDVVPTVQPAFNSAAIEQALMGVVGAAVGAFVALVVFLVSIMKA